MTQQCPPCNQNCRQGRDCPARRSTADAVRCIECTRFDLRADPAMARQGFGRCGTRPAWQYQSAVFARACDVFRAESADKVQARLEWYERRSKR